ncbi:hypothetical protein ACH5RR_023903 [Cinchona calisaya]|uniref:Uncharacterized protein n=1 Tax=Cinchona calisaya TaxID=153742 RepID=A0ABD2ZDU6_9GENT
MSGIFGGRDPFDDPFFTRPFGSLFGSSMSGSTAVSGDPTSGDRLKGLTIEEIDGEEGNIYGDEEDPENASANQNPLVEHPEDEADEHIKSKSEGKSKELIYRPNQIKAEGERPQKKGVSFQRVTCGGINGPYYTASTTRRTRSNGVVLEERKEADSSTGQATHCISKGIHNKGHSVTRKLNSDGKVDTTQTLHNLDEDELVGFERRWKGNADVHLPECDKAFDFHSSSGVGGRQPTPWSDWRLPFREQFNRDTGLIPDPDAQAQSARGRPRKVVTIPIE